MFSGRKDGKKDGDNQIRQDPSQRFDASRNYLYRDSYNVSHSDTILDMAIVEVD